MTAYYLYSKLWRSGVSRHIGTGGVPCSTCTTESQLQSAGQSYFYTWLGKTPAGDTGIVNYNSAGNQCQVGQGNATVLDVLGNGIAGTFYMCIVNVVEPGGGIIPTPEAVAIAITNGYAGTIFPKFQIVGVTYAPPGARSTVSYLNSQMIGTSTSNMSSFATSVSEVVTLSGGASVGILGADSSVGLSTTYTQETDNSSSVTIDTSAALGSVTPGPASSALGVDHAYDIVWVWLNPGINLLISGKSVSWLGYSYNTLDNANDGMEVVGLYVYQLQAPSSIATSDPSLAARLARSWDTSGVGGLNTTDYATILAADPLVSTSYNPLTDTTHRFDEVTSIGPVLYEPPPSGGQPFTTNYSVATSTTTTQGKGATHTYAESFSIDVKASESFIIFAKEDLKTTTSFTTTDKWSSSINSTIGKTASFSVTGPAVSDNYKGPVEFQVWRDNVYGAYMFYPVQ